MSAFRRSSVLIGLLGLAAATAASSAAADEAPARARASFALVIGANQSVDTSLPILKYADDDAVRYFDLFRLVGARTYLLSRLDENTRRLHPQGAAEAEEPRRAQLDRAVTQLAADVERARARGLDTVVYVVYAGHGDVKNGQAYVTLEDDRVTGAELAQIARRIPATRIHMIVDACASYFLARSRGPGGERRALQDFHAIALVDDPRVGLLLSTSSAKESHEWDAYQSGIFSHEVRSGLYGGADADGDGVVSYREIAAFVERANAAVPNEKYRPEVYARAPRESDALIDIKQAKGRRVRIDGAHAGHYYLEDWRGVRLADVHNGGGQPVELLRPGPGARAYLRRVDDDVEFTLEGAPDVVALADLTPAAPRDRARGAAHEAFQLLFAQPFDRTTVESYRAPPLVNDEAPPSDTSSPSRTRNVLGWIGVGAGVIALGTGGWLALRASSIGSQNSGLSNAAAAEQNDRVARYNVGAAASLTAGGVLAVAGAALLLWPSTSAVRVSWTPAGGTMSMGGSF